jgi:hypothetical protein
MELTLADANRLLAALPGFRGVFQLAAAHDFAPKGVY